MAFAFVQSKSASGAAAASPVLGATPTVGNLLLAFVNSPQPIASTTLPGNFTWFSDDDNAGAFSAHLGYRVVQAGDTTTPCAVSCTSGTLQVELAEFSGNNRTTIVDVAAIANDPIGTATTCPTASTGTLPTTSDLLFCGVSLVGTNGGTEAVDSGFTLLDDATLTVPVVAYKIKTNNTAEAPTFSWATSRGRTSLIAAFRAAATVPATAALPLGGLTVSAAGTPKVLGTAAVSLGGLTVAAAATPTVKGTAALPLGGLALSASGLVTVPGTAAMPLGGLTVAASGLVTVPGTAAANLGPLTLTAAGLVTVPGTAQLLLGAVTVAAAGRVTATILGAAALNLGPLTITAAATVHPPPGPDLNPRHITYREPAFHVAHTEAAHINHDEHAAVSYQEA